MKKFFLVATAAIAFAFVSCKKDNNTTPAPGTPSKLLTKMTKTENNITTVFNFLYDGNKRLASYKSTDNKTGVLFFPAETCFWEFFNKSMKTSCLN